MLPTFVLEPSSASKRTSYGRVLAAPKKHPFTSVRDLSARLKELRRAAITDLEVLTTQLSETLQSLPGVKVVKANDSREAVEAIRQACETSTVAVNQSAVVIQELAPELAGLGFRVVEPYYAEFPVSDSRFVDYYQIPESTADHLTLSFGATSLSDRRRIEIEECGIQDFVGLLGVNAISASDGTVFLMQHFHNISRTFQRARKLVMVVGVDKIVHGSDEAYLQALGMGVFGWGVKLLGLGRRGGEAGLESIPFLPSSQADSEVLVIIVDNGRLRLLDSPYRELLNCIGCRACIRGCPTQQFFGAERVWSPKEYLNFFLQGNSPSLDLCLSCGMCRVECPLDIDIPGMIIRARNDRSTGHSLGSILLSNFETIGRWGSRMPNLANATLNHPLPRWFADRTLRISKNAPLPTFHRDTLARWLRSRKSGVGD